MKTLHKLLFLFFITINFNLLGQSFWELQRDKGYYFEFGFNTLGSVDYTSNQNLESTSSPSDLFQTRLEVGYKLRASKRINFSLGFFSGSHSYFNNVFVPIDSETDLEIQSLFDLNFIGANIGMDHALFKIKYGKTKLDRITLSANVRLAASFLRNGTRTDEPIDSPSTIISNETTNLLLTDFRSFWTNLQYGYILSYRASYLIGINFRHHINSNLSSIETSSESYKFKSHSFSLGLIIYPWSL